MTAYLYTASDKNIESKVEPHFVITRVSLSQTILNLISQRTSMFRFANLILLFIILILVSMPLLLVLKLRFFFRACFLFLNVATREKVTCNHCAGVSHIRNIEV